MSSASHGTHAARPPAATYVFCLVRSESLPSLGGAPSGPPGTGPLRLLRFDRGIWIAVADASLAEFSETRLQQHLRDIERVSEHALAHAAVIEFFFRRSPVIPLKLFTLFSSDERALRHLRRRRDRIRRVLALVRGREEWGARLTLGPAAPEQDARGKRAGGRAYLEAKKQQRDRSRRPGRVVAREIAAALGPLSRLAAKTYRRDLTLPGGGAVVIAAAFLVPVGRRVVWKKRAAEVGDLMAERGGRLDVSGPWPPYHFVGGSGQVR